MKSILAQSLYLYICICSLVNGCSKFLNKSDLSLIISAGEVCVLSDESINDLILKKIVIEGTLSILDTVQLHLRYEHISIGDNGHLEIGKKKEILNNLIIFEQLGNTICSKSTTQTGTIEIKSRHFQSYELEFPIIKGSKQISLNAFPTQILSQQNYLLIDQWSSHQPELVTVQEIKQRNLFLKNSLENNYISSPLKYDNNRKWKFQPIFISDVPSISGVIFKNTCLTANVISFEGVTVLNPKGLYFRGNPIKKSLIKVDSQGEDYKNRTIHVQKGISKSFFIDCKNLTVVVAKGNDEQFEDNLIAFSNDFTLKLNYFSLGKVVMVSSKVIIDAMDIQYLNILSQSGFFNSEINIYNKVDFTVYIEWHVLFYKGQFMKFNNDIKQFKIRKAYLLSHVLNFSSAAISKSLSISDSLIDGNGELNHLVILKKSAQKQNIDLSGNTFLGYKSYLMTSNQKLDNPEDEEVYYARISSDILFYIELGFNQYNNYQKPEQNIIFNLPKMFQKINFNNQQSQFIVQVNKKDKNIMNNQYLSLPQYQWVPSEIYQIDNIPTSYLIKEIVLANSQNQNVQIKASMNDQSKYVLIQNTYYSILRDQIQHIHFEDSNGDTLDVQEFVLQFDQIQDQKSSQKEKILVFSSKNKAIKSITITKQNSNYSILVQKKFIQSFYYYFICYQQQSLNSFFFAWKSIDSLSYKIKFEYCPENEKFNGVECVTQCEQEQYLSGFFCSKDCAEGFYKDPNDAKVCLKCSLGCKVCTNKDQCTQCFDWYSLIDSKCIDVCPISQTMHNKKCQQCKKDCQSCSDPDSCQVCSKSIQDTQSPQNTIFNLNDKECVRCTENKYGGKCEDCPSNCKRCLDGKDYGCIECADGFERVHGQCIKKETIQIAKKCEFGSSLINNECLPCFEGCLTCSESNNQNKCTSCIEGYYKDKYGKGCQQCENGYYPESNSCYPCHSLCYANQTCLGPSVFQCVKCKTGYFKQLNTNRCQSCDLTQCKECQQTPTQCTDCSQGLFLYENKCYNSCPSQYYPDKNRVCQECNSLLCKECAMSPTQCTECNKGLVLQKEKCQEACDQGYFADKNNICRQCDMNKCVECIEHDKKCTKCQDDLYLISHNCETSCPEKGYFFDVQNKCQPCHEDCEKCVDTPTKCTDCEYPMYLEQNNKCVQECKTGWYGGYVQSASICLECDKECQTCINHKSKCTGCHQGQYLYQNKCISQCPVGTNQNDATRSCLVCLQPNCQVCADNVAQCLLCKHSYFQHSGICLKSCPNGYFPDQDLDVCRECDKRVCMECSLSPTTCTKCYPEHFNIGNSSCSTSCPRMTYPFQEGGQQTCKPCHPDCTQGCVGPLETECLEEAKNEVILIVLLIFCFILSAGLIILGYLYYKNKKKTSNPYLLRRASSYSDSGTVIQMERQESLKKI